MKHTGIRFRLILPAVLGFLAIVLMVWDYENNRMVALIGLGCDMGAPFWPYQAIYLLLFTVNAPEFVLSMPILRLLNLRTLSLQYGVWFPAIVGWWWWVGAGSSRVDAVCRAVHEGHIHRISRHPGEPEEQSGL